MDFSGKTILIVDDDRIIALAEASFLGKSGYNAVTAGSGEEVIAFFESGAECHMVLLDIDLGNGMNGPEIAERIHKMRDLPIVFVTSHTECDMTDKVRHIKKYGYVIKNSGDYVILSAIEMAFELFYDRKSADSGMSFVSTLLNTIPLPVFYKDRDGRYMGCNKAYESFMHTTQENVKGKTVFDLSPDEIAEKYYEMDQALFTNPGTQTYEWVIKSLNGELRYVIFNKATFNDHRGNVSGIIGVILDITDQKANEEKITNLLSEKDALLKEKEILLKEVHHRIKNNMSTISSLLLLQADAVKNQSAIDALNDARSRVMSMMIIYDKLYRSADFRNIQVRDYLVNLIHEIFSTFPERKNLNIEYEIDDFILDSKVLFPLGIIINELLTNCMKHAFPGGRDGKVNVSVKIDENGFIEASVSDNGVGIPESLNLSVTQSFGLNLIDLLTDQIGGHIIVNRMDGTEFIIKFIK